MFNQRLLRSNSRIINNELIQTKYFKYYPFPDIRRYIAAYYTNKPLFINIFELYKGDIRFAMKKHLRGGNLKKHNYRMLLKMTEEKRNNTLRSQLQQQYNIHI